MVYTINFDDGSLDCKNWAIASVEGAQFSSWAYIKKTYPELVPLIQERVKAGHYYLSCDGIYDDVVEIQWD